MRGGCSDRSFHHNAAFLLAFMIETNRGTLMRRLGLAFTALAACLGMGKGAIAPAYGQGNTPEWQRASSPEFYAISTLTMTQRVLARASVAELQQAAQNEDAAAAWILSYIYKRGMGGVAKNSGEAYRWSRKSCDLGNVRGCNALAYNLNGSVGTSRDQIEAMRIFERTCEQGVASSCAAAAETYLTGDGAFPKTPGRSLYFRTKACENGRVSDCRDAGAMVSRGEGTAKNPARAQELYARGCQGDDAISCFYAGRILERGALRGDYTGETIHQIIGFYERGCELDQAEACYNRGVQDNEGRFGRTQSTVAAVPWMEKACTLGKSDGCYNLGSWLISGRAGRTDGRRAIELLGPLCLRDKDPDIQACNNAGTAAYRGSGMAAPDFDSARKFYTRACYEGGLTASCRTLSDMYRDGQVRASEVGEAQWLDAQLCFKSGEQAYCKLNTRQYTILEQAQQRNYSSASSLAAGLCRQGDKQGCRFEFLLSACAKQSDNADIDKACRTAF